MCTFSSVKVLHCIRLIFITMILMLPALASAGPLEEGNAAIDRWSAAYSSNDVDAVVASYWPDAILLGTVSPVMSVGADAIRKYFTDLKLQGSGNKNVIHDRRTIVVDDNAIVVTGFGEWHIGHHHSSPHVLPKP